MKNLMSTAVLTTDGKSIVIIEPGNHHKNAGKQLVKRTVYLTDAIVWRSETRAAFYRKVKWGKKYELFEF
jgi:hypothetical protein